MPCPTAHPILPFVLPGFVIDEVQTEETALLIGARAVTTTRPCPDCGQFSIRIHSRYWRVVCDLPVTTQAVRLRLHVRRFFCDAPECPRRTFAERLPDLAPPQVPLGPAEIDERSSEQVLSVSQNRAVREVLRPADGRSRPMRPATPMVFRPKHIISAQPNGTATLAPDDRLALATDGTFDAPFFDRHSRPFIVTLVYSEN